MTAQQLCHRQAVLGFDAGLSDLVHAHGCNVRRSTDIFLEENIGCSICGGAYHRDRTQFLVEALDGCRTDVHIAAYRKTLQVLVPRKDATLPLLGGGDVVLSVTDIDGEPRAIAEICAENPRGWRRLGVGIRWMGWEIAYIASGFRADGCFMECDLGFGYCTGQRKWFCLKGGSIPFNNSLSMPLMRIMAGA